METSATVSPGDDICFGSVDKSDSSLLFDTPLPAETFVHFVPSGGGGCVLTSRVDTSCELPLKKPFAQVFEDPCTSPPFADPIDVSSESDVPAHLAFRDGTSRDYYEDVLALLGSNATSSTIRTFDITFENCGCECGDGAATSSPAVSAVR